MVPAREPWPLCAFCQVCAFFFATLAAFLQRPQRLRVLQISRCEKQCMVFVSDTGSNFVCSLKPVGVARAPGLSIARGT